MVLSKDSRNDIMKMYGQYLLCLREKNHKGKLAALSDIREFFHVKGYDYKGVDFIPHALFSKRQVDFIDTAKKYGFDIYLYQSRNGEYCPSVYVNALNNFPMVKFRETIQFISAGQKFIIYHT